MSAFRRIQNELKQIREDLDGITKSTGGYVQIFQSPDGDERKFQCVLQGPDKSPYDGGIFFLTLRVPADYPFKPPKIQFDTPIWHPNITFFDPAEDVESAATTATGAAAGDDDRGMIHLDILKDQWTSIWTLQSLTLVVWSLLMDPSIVEDPVNGPFTANPQAAREYRQNRQQFVNTARRYTRLFAGVEDTPRDQQIQATTISRLVQMMPSCSTRLARNVLERNNWNEDAAVTELLMMQGGDHEEEEEDLTSFVCGSDSSYSFIHEFSQLEVQEDAGTTTSGNTGAANHGAAAAGSGSSLSSARGRDDDDDNRIGGWVNIS